jgi:hypothetical protein
MSISIERITVSLPKAQAQAIKRLAAKRCQTVSMVVSLALGIVLRRSK